MPKLNQHRDPREFAKTLARPTRSRLILGCDLGTNAGYAFNYYRPGDRPTVLPQFMGQWNLSAGQYDSGAIRFVRMRQFLTYLSPDLVCYEDVKFDPPMGQFNKGALLARVATASEFLGAL